MAFVTPFALTSSGAATASSFTNVSSPQSSRTQFGALNAARLPRRAHVRQQRTAAKPSMVAAPPRAELSHVGLVGLAVMGQNLALNVADHGYKISVYNRSYAKTKSTVERAEAEGLSEKLVGFEDVRDFVASLQRPRKVILLVKAGKAVDATIETLQGLLEEGDLLIDGGNEFYTNTEVRAEMLKKVGIQYMGMGVSGGEEGARYGPSLMPGGPKPGYDIMEGLLKSIAAQVDDGPCVTYIGPNGSGNLVKMIHNGIEYGDMQLIGEVYDLMRSVGGMSHSEIADVFDEWNQAELQSFLVEITAQLLRTVDDVGADGKEALIEKVLDKTGSKGTGMWTVQEAARRGISAPTIAAALDARYLSSLKDDRVAASKVLSGPVVGDAASRLSAGERAQFVDDLRMALYASKICSYAQGMNIIRAAGEADKWNLNLGAISRIWKGGCIIRAKFLDRIKAAYDRDAALPSLLVDAEFAEELAGAQDSWRRVVCGAVNAGIAIPALSGSLAYYDTNRRAVLPSAQMVQSQRDFFGSHTYERIDMDGVFHTRWSSDGVSERQD